MPGMGDTTGIGPGANHQAWGYYRICTGGEANTSYTFTISGAAAPILGTMQAWSGVNTKTPFGGHSTMGVVTNNSAITVSKNIALVADTLYIDALLVYNNGLGGVSGALYSGGSAANYSTAHGVDQNYSGSKFNYHKITVNSADAASANYPTGSGNSTYLLGGHPGTSGWFSHIGFALVPATQTTGFAGAVNYAWSNSASALAINNTWSDGNVSGWGGMMPGMILYCRFSIGDKTKTFSSPLINFANTPLTASGALYDSAGAQVRAQGYYKMLTAADCAGVAMAAGSFEYPKATISGATNWGGMAYLIGGLSASSTLLDEQTLETGTTTTPDPPQVVANTTGAMVLVDFRKPTGSAIPTLTPSTGYTALTGTYNSGNNQWPMRGEYKYVTATPENPATLTTVSGVWYPTTVSFGPAAIVPTAGGVATRLVAQVTGHALRRGGRGGRR